MKSNKLYTTFFCILMMLGANPLKGAIPFRSYDERSLQKYAERHPFDASVRLDGRFLDEHKECSSSRVKISEDDSVDFYITAAHCVKKSEAFFDKQGVDVIIHPNSLDLALVTTGELSNKPKYPLYRGDLNNLVGKRLINVGFGMNFEGPLRGYKAGYERQAFDIIMGPIEMISTQAGRFYNMRSSSPMDDWPEPNELTPYGHANFGDSGGSLLLEEGGRYKLVGVTSCGGGTDSEAYTGWAGLDLDFIEDARKELLAKRAVYTYPSSPEAGSPIISFFLKDINSFTGKCPLERPLEMKENLIGYASLNAELIILVDGELFFNIPFELGRTYFTCQLTQQQYLIEVAVEKATEGKGFFVKGTILKGEKDKYAAFNLDDEVIIANDGDRNGVPCGGKIKPIYYSFFNVNDLPLEISLCSYLPNKDFIDAYLLENEEILGYAGDNYDIVIRLDGQKLKTLHSTEIWKDLKRVKFDYAGNTYMLNFQQLEGYNGEHIGLRVEKVSENLLRGPVELAPTTTGRLIPITTEKLIPIDFNPFDSNWMSTSLDLLNGVELFDDKSGKTYYYAKADSQIQLKISGLVVKNFSLDEEGCHYFTHKEGEVLYVAEVNIQKSNFPTKYTVDWTLKELELKEGLAPLVLADESCESTVVNPIECSLTDTAKAVAGDLNLHIVLDRSFPQQSPLLEGCIGYGSGDSIVRIFSGSSKKLGQTSVSSKFNDFFELNGKSYSISLKSVFEKDRWHIVLDIQEIQPCLL